MRDETLVLALGNPLRGDDGAAGAVLAQLAGLPLPDTVVLRDGGTPIANVETVHRTVSTCHLCNIAMLLKRKLQWG